MKKFICSILICSLIFINGCVEKSVQGSKNEEVKNYIVYNIGKAPEDLIMLDKYDRRQQDLLVNLFEGLVKTDERGTIIPALSESWSISKDETCYTFNIRENAKWSNGSDITADDFVTFFSRILNKDVKNIYVSQLYYIFGAEEYNKGKCNFDNVAIRAIDRKKLEIRLNYPCNYLLNILSEPIYSLRKIDNNLMDWKRKYKDIAYSGSFQIDGISQEGNIILKKNNNYWDKESIRSDKIVVSCIEGSEASLAAFQNNEVDLFINPPINELKNLTDSGKVTKRPSFEGSALVFNMKKDSILKDINIRKAISIDIDRKNIAKEILNDTVEPALTFVPAGINDGIGGRFIDKNYFAATSEENKAIELLKKSKFEKNNEALKLIYLDTIENKRLCENIAKNLNDNLGIKIECQGYGANEFSDELKGNDYDIAKVNYGGSYDYPLAFLEPWMSSSDTNVCGYKDTKFDTAIVKIKMEKDKTKKVELLREAQNIFLEDAVVVPLYLNNISICKKSNVEGVSVDKYGNVRLEKAYMFSKP